MNDQIQLTENELSFEIELTDKDGFIVGHVDVPAILPNSIVGYLVREAEGGIYVTPAILNSLNAA